MVVIDDAEDACAALMPLALLAEGGAAGGANASAKPPSSFNATRMDAVAARRRLRRLNMIVLMMM
jgi:hypothetical protein